MSPIEIRQNASYKWRMALVAVVAGGVLYFYLGYLPLVVWVGLIVLVIVLLFSLITGQSKDPVIVLNDEGVLDRRLKIGVIRWEDIRRISSQDIQGALYISLELHDKKHYEDRRPMWLKLTSQVQRGLGVSSIAITTNGLDMNHDTLVELIHDGCEEASQRNVVTA